MRALVVGAGCCGAGAARRLAEYGWEVTVVDRRAHIGGNAYDRRDSRGILYHVYGPHVFFTDRERVWNFLSPFADWEPFRCSLKVRIEGEFLPMPFQPETLRRLLPEEGARAVEAMNRRWSEREWVTVLDLLACDDPLLQLAGRRLYDCDCVPYNQKQWGLRPEELSPEVSARAPVYLRDRLYFRPERFQFMPKQGFAPLFQAILNHPLIRVQTGLDGLELMTVSGGEIVWRGEARWDAVLYTGEVDRLFGFCAGRLPYRRLRFDQWYCPAQEGLPGLAVYYPEPEYPWTRCTDYRYLPGNRADLEQTLVIGERAGPLEGPEDEPCYVVLTEQSKRQYQKYQKMLHRVPHLYAAGRLAEFRYYNMDQAVERGLEAADIIQRQEGGGFS